MVGAFFYEKFHKFSEGISSFLSSYFMVKSTYLLLEVHKRISRGKINFPPHPKMAQSPPTQYILFGFVYRTGIVRSGHSSYLVLKVHDFLGKKKLDQNHN